MVVMPSKCSDDVTTVQQTFSDFWVRISDYPVTGVVLAYSGGLDSSVLLHLCQQAPWPVRAVHIHHGLHPAADRWLAHCETTAAALQIPLTTIRLDTAPAPGESIEAWARAARYQALIETLQPGECLLTAHHQDDQAETLLIQLCRGAGVKGLAAMSAWRLLNNTYHGRPLLGLSRSILMAYATLHRLGYCHDDSNDDVRFLRNHLRHQVIPLLRRDFPDVQANLARAALHCAEADALLTDLAYIDIPDLAPGPLDIRRLSMYAWPRQKNILRTWLALQGMSMPSALTMTVLRDEVMHSRYDKTPLLTWENIAIRRYGHWLYLQIPRPTCPASWSVTWDLQHDLMLPSDLGTISAASMSAWLAYQPLTVRFRREGESVHLLGHKHRKTLKNLFQQYRVPPWLRDSTPLIFKDDTLIAIVGYYIASQSLLSGVKSLIGLVHVD